MRRRSRKRLRPTNPPPVKGCAGAQGLVMLLDAGKGKPTWKSGGRSACHPGDTGTVVSVLEVRMDRADATLQPTFYTEELELLP